MPRKPTRSSPRAETSPAPEASRRDFPPVALPLLVGIVTFLTFLPALQNQLLEWDDQQNIIDNTHIRALSWDNIHWMFTHYLMGHYQPLALLTYAIDHAIWGPEGFGFHLTNIVIHAVNATIVYFLLVRLLESALPAMKTPQRPARWAAAVGALLFSVHPLRVESVAWATERRDVLSAAFYLLAILCYLIAHERRIAGRSVRGWMTGVYLLTVLSFFTRVIAITLTPVLLVLDLYPLGRWHSGRPWRELKPLIVEKLPIVALSLVMMFVATRAQAQENAWVGLPSQGMPLHILAAFYCFSFYLLKTILPIHLLPLYEMPLRVEEVDMLVVIAGVLVVLSGPVLLAWRRRWGPYLSAWAVYAILLGPTLGLFQNWPQIAADRYTYLANLAWVACIAALLHKQGLVVAGSTRGRRGLAASGAVVAALAITTALQIRVWRDDRTMWHHVLTHAPNTGIALGNMANMSIREGDAVSTEHYARRAARRQPWNTKFWDNLGLAIAKQDRLEEARQILEHSLSIKETATPLAGLAHIKARQGDLTEAERLIRRSLELDPKKVESRAILADILRRQRRFDEAVAEFSSLRAEQPDDWNITRRLTDTLLEAGRFDEAAGTLHQYISRAPSDPRGAAALAQTILKNPERSTQATEEALRAAEKAVQLTGGRVPDYLLTLAHALRTAGRTQDAADAARRALEAARQMDNAGLLEQCNAFLRDSSTSQPASHPSLH